MTIHPEHPFAPPPGERDPLRRLRGRMPAPVSVWTAGTGRDRVGLTVSSFLLAAGNPDRVLGLVDEESSLWDEQPTTVVINLLGPSHEYLAEVFAGQAPAPGGPFTLGDWTDTAWGPRLADAVGAIAVRLDPAPRPLGFSLALEGTVEQVDVLSEDALLLHRRGRYET